MNARFVSGHGTSVRVYADTKDENVVYVLNVAFHRSGDGGKTFKTIHTPHGDHHDLWIDPDNNKRMIVADDGGAQVTFDGGENWSTYYNQPTAQFYRVSTDNHFPYRIYGAQQDNSSLRINHRSFTSGSITQDDWEPTAGFESGHIVADPLNDDIVYGGNYDGFIGRLNHKTGENRATSPYGPMPILVVVPTVHATVFSGTSRCSFRRMRRNDCMPRPMFCFIRKTKESRGNKSRLT
jgi:hypothetical protein